MLQLLVFACIPAIYSIGENILLRDVWLLRGSFGAQAGAQRAATLRLSIYQSITCAVFSKAIHFFAVPLICLRLEQSLFLPETCAGHLCRYTDESQEPNDIS